MASGGIPELDHTPALTEVICWPSGDQEKAHTEPHVHGRSGLNTQGMIHVMRCLSGGLRRVAALARLQGGGDNHEEH